MTQIQPRFALILVSILGCLVSLPTVGCDFRTGASEVRPALDGGKLVASEAFSEPTVSPARWNDTSSGGWVVIEGQLHSKGVQNQALWFRQPLPDRVRVEFDARSESEDGDIKAEIFGDGATHASGYVVIFGGWKNSVNAIARLDEHGKDRLEGAHGRKVEKGRTYHVAVVRDQGDLEWYVDGRPMMTFPDAAALRGDKHKFFAFNDWAVPVYFDNLAIYDLSLTEDR
jgi:hypothetical protein